MRASLSRHLAGVTVAGILVVALAGRAGGSDAVSSSAVAESVTVSQVAGDGTLLIAAMLPGTTDDSSYTDAVEAGVQLAVRDIEASGLGPAVSLVLRDAGTSTEVPEGADVVYFPFLGEAEAPTGVVVAQVGDAPVTASDDFVARLEAISPLLEDSRYAAESYDAVIVAALADLVAGSDAAVSVGSALPLVSVSDGYACTSFGDCATALSEGESIHYVGQSGTAERSADGLAVGDLSLALF